MTSQISTGRFDVWHLLIIMSLLVGACGSEPPVELSGCQEQALGAAECIDTNDCHRRVESWLDYMDGPEIPTSDAPEQTITNAACEQVHVTFDGRSVSGSACLCDLSNGGGHPSVGPMGVGCFLFDRARHCLWGDSEFFGCSGEPESLCEEHCDRILELRRQARLQTFDTELVHVECTSDHRCKSVARVDDQCFVDEQWVGPAPCDLDSLAGSEPVQNQPAPDDGQARCKASLSAR